MPIALLSSAGLAGLSVLSGARALFAFDFDGTLAPIRERPEDVRIEPSLARRLQQLADVAPVAIVTGRRVEDVRERLGFVPRVIVGSHGAEDHADPRGASRWADALSPLRVHLLASRLELQRTGVVVEDKAQSIALHYRGAADQETARAAIERAVSPMLSTLRRFEGKQVVNLVAAEAPDKAAAVRGLLAELDCETLFFAGDDLNDEPVFESAHPAWVTVKVGPETSSSARFSLDDQGQMAAAVECLLRAATARSAGGPQSSASGV